MSLADLIAKQPVRRGGTKCATCTWRDQLNKADRKTFDEAVERIRTNGGGAAHLHAACAAMGLDVKVNTFGNHVRSGH